MDELLFAASSAWLFMVFVWPIAVVVSVLLWIVLAVIFLRRGRRVGVWVSSFLAALLVGVTGAVGVAWDQPALATLPSQLRPDVQVIVVVLPWALAAMACVALCLVGMRSGNQSPNPSLQGTRDKAARP